MDPTSKPGGLDQPFWFGTDVVPNDDDDLPQAATLYLGAEGDICGITAGGTEVTLRNHPVGYVLGVYTRVKATGTTADNIVALW
ncbi:spike base protein, RCAP_Rcc01079 family [Martelella sp. AMO21009]